MRCWTLRPADFAFLWEECKRCFYLKVVRGLPRPRPATPRGLTVLDARMRSSFARRRTETIASEMPAGVLEYGAQRVESAPTVVHLPDGTATFAIRGTLDTVVRFDDGTCGVVDWKTSAQAAEHIALYTRQLHAYAHALEHAAAGRLGLGPVSRLGLLVFEPRAVSNGDRGVSVCGRLAWVEVERDDQAFFGFIAEVLSVLEQPSPPGGTPLCAWCQYRDISRRTGL